MTSYRLSPRSALIGAVTGSRSMLGLTGVALRAPVAVSGPLSRPWVRGLLTLGAVGELVGDKLPMTPSRLRPPGLGARIVVGGLAGAALAQRDGAIGRRQIGPAAAVGAIAALVSSFAGARWRGLAAERFGRDLPGALIEDAVAIVGTAVAAR